jgi:hypothetical protein
MPQKMIDELEGRFLMLDNEYQELKQGGQDVQQKKGD